MIHENMKEAFGTKRTRGALATDLVQWAEWRRKGEIDGYKADEGLTDLLEEAADALRSMPEGERIEGIAWKDGDAFCTGALTGKRCQESYVFVPHCEHETKEEYHISEEERSCTLIIQHREDKSDGS